MTRHLGNHKWRLRAVLVSSAMAFANVAVLATPALAANTCTFDAGTHAVTVTLDSGATPTLSVASGDIQMNGTSCGATTTTAQTIAVTGAAGAETLTVADPAAFEAIHTIVFAVDLAGGTSDIVTLSAAAAGSTFRAGVNGVDFNNNNVLDMTLANVETLDLEGGAGNDVFNANGGVDPSVLGAPYGGATTMNGGAGDDTMTGGAGIDTINGNAGNDVIDGAAGNDTLKGNEGNDTVSFASSAAGVIANLTTSTATGNGNDILDATVENLFGSAGNDNLTGDGNDNVLTGAAGDDSLTGLAGIDIADYSDSAAGVTVDLSKQGPPPAAQTTGDGSDTLSSVEGVSGSAFDDVLLGTTAAETLLGAGGDDRLQGKGGADTLNGGPGNDTGDFSDQTGALTIDLNATGAQTGAGGATLTNVENLIGGSAGDTFTGDGNANALDGGAGDDTLEGAGGADVLTGGDGTDTATYASAPAVAVDLSKTTAQNTNGAGIDTLATIENLTGGAGNDALTGDANANVLDGGAGNDALGGGAGNDTLTGGAGNDMLTGGAGDDAVTGGDGTDTASYAGSAAGVTVDLAVTAAQATGGAGSDTLATVENLVGSAHNDTLKGDATSNVLTGGAGNDVLNGLGGTDTADYSTSSAPVAVDLSVTVAQNTGGAGSDTITNVENLNGGIGDDLLAGNAAANAISGGNGDDLLLGAAGDDTLNGGQGDDLADYEDAPAGVTVDLSIATAQNTVAAGMDTLASIEGIVGSAFGDTLSGDTNDNLIIGGPGDDVMTGGTGGEDTVSFEGASAGVTVNLGKTGAQVTGEGTDTITGFEDLAGSDFNDSLSGNSDANAIDGLGGNDRVQGNAGDDALFGGAGNDIVAAGIGNDVLSGDDGNDLLYADAGNDRVIGGRGVDTITYASSPNGVVVSLGYGSTGFGADRIFGVEYLNGSRFNDRLAGTAGANVIHGGVGNDVIFGLGGGDVLYGDTGTDALNGGDGFDRCVDVSGTRAAACERAS
jgi:Ca2+-binding RTX toxin-like protein